MSFDIEIKRNSAKKKKQKDKKIIQRKGDKRGKTSGINNSN